MAKQQRIIGYVRVSTSKQADQGVSIAAQEEKIQAYAKLYDHVLVDVLIEVASSKSLEKRPKLAEILRLIELGEVDGILVSKLDRLSRRVVDMGNLIDQYFQTAQLMSVSDQIDTTSPNGRMMLNIVTTMAQWERETIAERTKTALSHIRKAGVPLGRSKFGQTHLEEIDTNGRRVIGEVGREQKTIELIVALKARGHSLRKIATLLTLSEEPTKNGGRWHASTVRNILARTKDLTTVLQIAI